MTINLAEWREDAQEDYELALGARPGWAQGEVITLSRRLLAACAALEAYQSGVRAFRAGDPSSAALAFADAEDALDEGDKG